MTFFDVPPLEEEEDELPGPEEYSEGRWLTGVLPVEQFVGKSGQAAVAVRRISALPDSFEVEVVAWLREPPRRRRRRFGPYDRGIVLAAHGPWGIREEDGSLPDELVRFGVQFPDGGRATNLDVEHRWPDASDPQHGMMSQGGSSSPGEAEQRFTIWPLPAAGDIVFVCAWPAYEIEESRLTIDGDELRAAAARAQPVWPGDPLPRGSGGRRSSGGLSGYRSRIHAVRTRIAAESEPAAAADPAGQERQEGQE